MKTFLVGGAVRDTLLGVDATDKDFVVVGSTRDEMLSLGFKQVGADFPVFLHPETSDEYALARKERSTGNGYKDFQVDQSSSVTLEEDLSRRDLTINALAMDDKDVLFDFFGGQDDIKNKILRHISDSFMEDPVRVLRVARFAAKLGFTVHPSTISLMQKMVNKGMLDALVAERVFEEMRKALRTDNPWLFFETLDICGALKVVFPEIHALKGQTQPLEHHPEGDAFIHTKLVLNEAVNVSQDLDVRFAALCHDLGKGLTPKEELPKHHGHEEKGVHVVMSLCDRLRVPKSWKELAVMSCREHLNIHRFKELNHKSIVKLFNRCNSYKNQDMFYKMLVVSVCDANGRGDTKPKIKMDKTEVIMELLDFTNNIDINSILSKGFKGAQIGEQVHQQRCANAKRWRLDNAEKL